MWSRYTLAALALQSLAQSASAGVVKRDYDVPGDVTLTRTVTRQSSGVDGSATAVVDTETIVPTIVTSYIDGTTIFVSSTITLDCTKCEAASSSEAAASSAAEASKTATLSEAGATTTEESSGEATTAVESSGEATTTGESSGEATSSADDDDEECPTDTDDDYDFTTATATPDQTPGETTVEGSAASSALAEGTSSASVSTDYGDATGAGSSVASSALAEGTSSASTESGEATEAGSSVATEYTPTSISIILSTGYTNVASTQAGIFTNSTGYSVPTGTSEGETDGGYVITQTVTRGSAVETEISTVTDTISNPVVIVVRQVTVFVFTYAIGANCPAVKPGNSGSYVVGEGEDSESHTEIGTACSAACYKQFKSCTAASGKNFDLQDCKDQLSACLASASTQTEESDASTVSQTVVLPPDATDGAETSYITGATVISTVVLTVGEVCTVGTGGVSIVTVTGYPAETTAASSALGVATTESAVMVETTQGVTVSYVNEQGSTITDITTMIITVPCTKCAAAASSTAAGVSTSVEGSQSGETVILTESTISLPATGTASTGEISVVTLTRTIPYGGEASTSVEGSQSGETGVLTATSSSSGEETSHISVVTLTNTVSNSNGEGSTVVYSESTFTLPATGDETAPYGTGSYSTKTIPYGGEETQTAETAIDSTAITIPASVDSSAASSALAGSTTVSGSLTGVTGVPGDATTSLITMSASGTTSIYTMTLSGSYPAGSGTGIYEVPATTSEAAAETETISGTQTGLEGDSSTSYVTLTVSPTCDTCSAEETVITVTVDTPGATASSAEAGTATHLVSTQYVTVTMGGSTGVISLTMTGPGAAETITVGGGSAETITVGGGSAETVYVTEGSGKTITVGGKTETITAGGVTETIYQTEATTTITKTGAASTVTITRDCTNGECSVRGETATGGSVETVTVGGGSNTAVTITETSVQTITTCPVSEAAVATTLATATTKAPATVYVTQTVDKRAANTGTAMWRRVLGF
ncbi:hypothetical protein G7Z17_g10946 [Cylindrodendrum hubeiense]|uniref:Uncharacterized protein n=1 Tax=Cylindrodendrum hubeiense TaxID=595255 RepID=A0A9P5H3X0_9HYPO|nr:hypothetical protein G7Z17_g10946 [Cylindrodendrum hubeiense]